jgi:hypothetical protein
MDIMANGMSVDAFLRTDCPVLPRLLTKGPVRRVRDEFVRTALRATGARTVLEIGGGRGGDCNLWALAPTVRCVEVVEPDGDAVAEYRRRLVASHRAVVVVGVAAAADTLTLPDGRCFRFHIVPLFDLDPAVGRGCDLAVLNFSVSQIVGGQTDLDALVGGLVGPTARGIRYVAVVAHDHVYAGLGGTVAADGVTCRRIEGTGCARHHLFCTCPSKRGRSAAVLHTTVTGSLMANGIREYAFGAVYLERSVRRMRDIHKRIPSTTTVVVHRPYATDDHHWLLRSLVTVSIRADDAAANRPPFVSDKPVVERRG